MIGLTRYQIEFNRARLEFTWLRRPELMKKYFELTTRDKRFDRTVMAAIRAGKPVTGENPERGSSAGFAIKPASSAGNAGRTETMMALGSARDEAMRQQIEAGKVQVQDVKKRWHSPETTG